MWRRGRLLKTAAGSQFLTGGTPLEAAPQRGAPPARPLPNAPAASAPPPAYGPSRTARPHTARPLHTAHPLRTACPLHKAPPTSAHPHKASPTAVTTKISSRRDERHSSLFVNCTSISTSSQIVCTFLLPLASTGASEALRSSDAFCWYTLSPSKSQRSYTTSKPHRNHTPVIHATGVSASDECT